VWCCHPLLCCGWMSFCGAGFLWDRKTSFPYPFHSSEGSGVARPPLSASASRVCCLYPTYTPAALLLM
jgi:hypothetical protein